MVGCLLTASGAPRRMMNCLDAVAGWLPGGSATNTGMVANRFISISTI